MASTTPTLELELEPSLYSLNDKELEFFKGQTGIRDDEELKEHILAVQKEAWVVFPYPCIRAFRFAILKISRMPAYPDFLKLGKERNGAIFIDFGCCFGNDARKAVADGYPIENVLTTDLRQEFWDLGHRLFKSSPETFPVPFIAGDIFDSKHISHAAPSYTLSTTPIPPLSSLTSLTPLQGRVSAIHVSSFFHLFDEAEQLQAAKALASLLSPEPGSMIFGEHASQATRGPRVVRSSAGKIGFCHPPESWRELWDGVVFEKGTVSVDAELHTVERKMLADQPPRTSQRLIWCVKRL